VSSLVFPNYLPGIAWPVVKAPVFKTQVQEALSGKESRIQYMQYQRYRFEMSFAHLPDDTVRTNMILNSQSNSGLSGGSPTVTQAITAPDGTYTASQVSASGGTLGAWITAYTTGDYGVTGAAYTGSMWLRAPAGTTQQVRLNLNMNNYSDPFIVTDQWRKYSFTDVAVVGHALQVAVAYPAGTNAATTLYVWGGQAEPGYMATLSIPTGAAAVSVSDYATMTRLFEVMAGQYDTFLFSDPSFCSVSKMLFGTGTGSQTQFQLRAAKQAYSDPSGVTGMQMVQDLHGAPTIYDNGSLVSGANYSIGATGIVTFNSAPTNGHLLTWTGSFYYRCRFLMDEQDFEQFMFNWWETKKLQFKSIKL
jgi:hypothetical protein